MSDLGVQILESSTRQSFDTLQLIEKNTFPSFIGNHKVEVAPTYLVIIDPENLFFSVKIPISKNYDQSLSQGQFKANLWKQDLVEIFMASDRGETYQEFNLAPTGAYWTVKFSKYRERIPESESATLGLEIECRATISGKVLSIKIPRSEIIAGCSFSAESRLSCCAILGKDPRNYYSTAELNPEKPDFHDISKWNSIKLAPLAFNLP